MRLGILSHAVMAMAAFMGPLAGMQSAHDIGFPTRAPVPKRSERREVRATGSYSRRNRRTGPGWTAAHVKRMAQKRRNVARNRRAHR